MMTNLNNNQGRGTQAASLTVNIVRDGMVLPNQSIGPGTKLWSIFSKLDNEETPSEELSKILQISQNWWSEIYPDVKKDNPNKIPEITYKLLTSWFNSMCDGPLLYPETFCIPRVQSLVACFIAATAVNYSGVEIDTTSEVIVRTLQALVLGGKISHTDILVMEGSEGQETGEEYHLNPDGTFDKEFASGFYDATADILLYQFLNRKR